MTQRNSLRFPAAIGFGLVIALAFLLFMTVVQWRLGWPTRTMVGAEQAAGDSSELRQLQEAQRKQLASYRWLDKSKGVVGIPIDRAMELVFRESGPAGQ